MAAFIDHQACVDWATVAEVRSCCARIDCATIPDADIQEAIEIASEILYLASGHQFSGTCTSVVRPCVQGGCGCWDTWFDGDPCSCCRGYRKIDLGLWPITNVVEVDIEGVILPASEYAIHNYRYLVRKPVAPLFERTDWPVCQFMDRDPGDPGTFTVTVEHGIAVPAMGRRAARELACEYIALCSGQPCQLPQNVKGITRQGVSFDMTDPTELRDLGLFGIPAVDVFLTTYNPKKLQSASFVWSPDMQSSGNVRG
jgi:hypothetical protein